MKKLIFTVLLALSATLFSDLKADVINDSIVSYKKQASKLGISINTYFNAKTYAKTLTMSTLPKDSITSWKKQASKISVDINSYLSARIMLAPTLTGSVGAVPYFNTATTMTNTSMNFDGSNFSINTPSNTLIGSLFTASANNNQHAFEVRVSPSDLSSIAYGVFDNTLYNWRFRANKGGGISQITNQNNFFNTTGSTNFGSQEYFYAKLGVYAPNEHGLAIYANGTDPNNIAFGVLGVSPLGWVTRFDKGGNVNLTLPKSSAGLSVGSLYNDNGTVKIVQ